jgi:hypothetical protein
MSIQIQVRRGTKSQLDTVMAGGSPVAQGELGFTTDTNEVFVSDGSSAHLVGKVMLGTLASRPTAGISGRIFHATDDGGTFVDNGTSWTDVSAGISDLDDIADGTTYGKVLNTYLDSNRVDGVYNGTSKLTGLTIQNHIDDTGKHREINDSGSNATDLWSAEKIQLSIDQAIAGMDFQADVLGVQSDATLDPGTPSVGDRYVITNSSTLHASFGTISGLEDNDIVEYDGASFVVSYDVSTQGEGVLVWNQADDTYQKFDGSSWSEFGGLSGVTAGDGLSKSGNTINVGAGDGIDLASDTISVDASDLAGTGLSEDGSNNLRVGSQGNGIAGGDGTTLSVDPDSSTGATVAPVSVTANGVGVLIDNDSLSHSTGTIEVVKVDGGSFV